MILGQTVGPYEVLAKLGAGGMGEVWRARDTRLHRDVAIKAMPESVASDPERIARFEREAQILASLKHPGIGGIHGIEEAGGARYLVLEYIEGASLAQTLARAPIPMDDAIGIARQIADALEAAHEKGVVHRDLKPANIMLTPDGTVKILDFGLAKALAPDGASGTADGMNSPTLTAATHVGVILGTAAYMAPEQAKGKAADKRSDVWAFGCVFFELLTRTRAFSGDDVSDTLAAVLRGEPDWTLLPASTPAPIVQLIKRCLAKDRRQRIPDISVARFTIDEWSTGGSGTSAPTAVAQAPPAPTRRGPIVAAALAAALLGAAGAAAVIYSMFWPQPEVVRPVRFKIDPPSAANPRTRTSGPGVDVVIAADASRLVYRVATPNGEMLAMRELSGVDSVLLPIGGGVPQGYSLSPDGSALVFYVDSALLHYAFSGSRTSRVLELAAAPNGTDWISNDEIVYASLGKIYRLRVSGGAPETIAEPPAAAEGAQPTAYLFPDALPGDDLLLYTASQGTARRIEARPLSGGDPVVVVDNASFPKLTASGRLYFVRDARLYTARFSFSTRTITGPAVLLDEDVGPFKPRGASSFDVSANGTFVALSASGLPYSSHFVWRSRSGAVLGHVGAEDLEYPRYPRLSHDDRRLAATIGAGNQGHLWMFDLKGNAQPQKLTFDGHNVFPMWTPDDKSLVFWTNAIAGEGRTFRIMPADGSNLAPKTIGQMPANTTGALAPDGVTVLFQSVTPDTQVDISVVTIGSNEPAKPWIAERFVEVTPAFSPNGKWVAYASSQTGTMEAWVRPFPGPGAPIRISTGGGREPLWSRDGREVFFQFENKLFAVPITITGTTLTPGAAQMLFEGGFVPFEDTTPRTYDVSLDGRFLMIAQPKLTERTSVTVVVGFDKSK